MLTIKRAASGIVTLAVAGAVFASTPAGAQTTLAQSAPVRSPVQYTALQGGRTAIVLDDHHHHRYHHYRHYRHHRYHHYRHHRYHHYRHYRHHRYMPYQGQYQGQGY